MSKLLFDEYPLVILPTLATIIGLNEAIVLQQINYWLNNKCIQTPDHFFEGRYWIYNSYPEWKKQLPFFSERTIQRIILNLEKMGLILSGNFSKDPMKRSKWYTINFAALNALKPDSTTTRHIGTMHPPHDATEVENAPRQIGTIDGDKLARCYTETNLSETTHLSKDKCNALLSPKVSQEKEERACKPRKKEVEHMAQTWNATVSVSGATPTRMHLMSPTTEKLAIEAYTKLQEDGWQELLGIVAGSSFLNGDNDRGFRATFAWVLKSANLEKIMDGFYSPQVTVQNEDARAEKNRLIREENKRIEKMYRGEEHGDE